MKKPTILLLSLTLSISISLTQAKDVALLTPFTRNETKCPETPVNSSDCLCATDNPNLPRGIRFDRKIDIAFGPDDHVYEFYQMSKVITELSPDGFVLLTDKYYCPPGVDVCTVRTDEAKIFSVTSDFPKISSISLDWWNTLLGKSGLSYTSTAWFECMFEANTTGYMAIRPMVEKVLGWRFTQRCSTSDCWPGSHPCSVCPEENRADQEHCAWLGKAPKINSADGTIDGEHRCIVAENEDEALSILNNPADERSTPARKQVRLPNKWEL